MPESALRDLAAKYLWWLPSEVGASRTTALLCQVMQLGTWEDFVTARTVLGDDAFRRALREAPPGVLDRRSWFFWTRFYGVERPMPERVISP